MHFQFWTVCFGPDLQNLGLYGWNFLRAGRLHWVKYKKVTHIFNLASFPCGKDNCIKNAFCLCVWLEQTYTATVKAVCYPNSSCGTDHCTAIGWGQQNEENGRTQYRLHIEKQHCNFEKRQCGFIVNSHFPVVGALPDWIVQCTCCGRGCLEIRCPYKYCENTVKEACNCGDRNFCLESLNGELQLKNFHPFHKQILTQIFVAYAEYCDFVLWTLKDFTVLHVTPDPQLRISLLKKAQQFLWACDSQNLWAVMLPELQGRGHSKR